ncbi:MAG: PAS domain-containing sensor histidine kinase [Desulforhopalus sp.]
MGSFSAKVGADIPSLFRCRNQLLSTIHRQTLLAPEEQNRSAVCQQYCNILTESLGYSTVLAYEYHAGTAAPAIVAATFANPDQKRLVENAVAASITSSFVWKPEAHGSWIDLEPPAAPPVPGDSGHVHLRLRPISCQQHLYGFIAVVDDGTEPEDLLREEFVNHIVDDLGLALYFHDTALRLRIERDFNKDIVDTIEALMVTIHPCGTILSFNNRAEMVTGFRQEEVVDKYWVDVLITPQDRLEFQQLFSETLRRPQASINFTAPLLTKEGRKRDISWHGSIRHNIEHGQVGMVMLGIDQTENLAAGQQLNMLTARWEKIFIAIQDPALVVSNDSIILEANPATFAAAKKSRGEVIGRKVCDIVHGGHGGENSCPLEQFIGYQKTQISETELQGLHGTYMLTVTPLMEENGEINATLLLARNLTEEEVLRAEAIRAAQLAAIGELASGIAHEINNPINGIINYAQIILDAPLDPEAGDNLKNIISEGKRIAGIVSSLLDFARRREEALAPSRIEKIVNNSLMLVNHLLKKDGIIYSVTFDDNIPELLCNEQQLQQVVLNLISNSRYALNKRYPHPCPEKKLVISAKLYDRGEGKIIRLVFKDYGVGIPPEIRDRLFDPFFSTKPKGEGTGLGLSISHGLVQDHGGNIRVRSELNRWTKFLIDLPVNCP